MEYDTLIERKSLTFITPKISSNLEVGKLTEVFLDLLSRLVRARNILLIYVIRNKVEVSNDMLLHLPEG